MRPVFTALFAVSRRSVVGGAFALLAFATPFAASFAEETTPTVSAQKSDDGSIRVYVDDEFFAGYLPDAQGTPIVWPLRTPNGALATRGWPMIDAIDVAAEPDPTMKAIYQNAKIGERGGAKDHPHHRSLWFDHGAVKGGDFWTLTDSIIRQTELVSLDCDGATAVLVTKNRWFNNKLDRDVCEDLRTLRFGVLPNGQVGGKNVRYVDFSVRITALEDGVVFGDTKEGTFGVRTPSPTALTAKKTNPRWGGRILDDAGRKDGETWGKRSAWVDYSGPAARFLEGNELARELARGEQATDFPLTTIGVAVLNGPESWAFPSWRHVRDYGLFATNPFGQRDFEPKNKAADGSKTLNRGETLRFEYRVLLHDGDLTASDLDAAFDAYSQEVRP